MDILQPTLLDVPISFFEYDHVREAFANVPSQTTTLRRMSSTKFYKEPIEAIRSEPEEDRQKALKKVLPAITPVALLHHRKKNTSFAERIHQQWPLMIGDIDQKDNPGVDMAELKQALSRLPYILLCAYSVRNGLWFVIRLPNSQTPETLAAHFRYIQKLFSSRFGIVLDSTKGGNPTDLRYVSYDAEPYTNGDATIMSGTYTPRPPKQPVVDFSRFRDRDEGYLVTRLAHSAQAAADGQRHVTLRNNAITAGGYIAAGRMDEQTAVYALETVASEWPDFSKSQKTIRDGIRYGLQKPIYPEPQYEQGNYGRDSSPQVSYLQPVVQQPAEPIAVSSRQTPPVIVNTLAEQLAHPGSILRLDESQIERLTVEPADTYPPEWDEPNPPDAIPTIKSMNFFEWQRHNEYFSQLGLASLKAHQS